MTRKKRTILKIAAVAVFLGLPACLILPGLLRCRAYHRIVSRPSWLRRLSVKPTKIQLPVTTQTSVLSLGYSQFAVKPQSVRSIECHGTAVIIDCNGWDCCFLPPLSQTYDNFKAELVKMEADFAAKSEELGIPIEGPGVSKKQCESLESDSLAGRLTRQMIEHPYDWSVTVANTLPKKYSEVFFEGSDEFEEYLLLAVSKVLRPHSQNGIGIFESEYVRGLVYFGMPKKPGELNAEVFSKDSNISQGIVLRSDSPKTSRKALLSLLVSYKFLIAEVPDKDSLRELIRTELEKHDKFQVAK